MALYIYIVFWMIDPLKKHQITMKAELEITSNIDMNTRDLITGTYPSTTYMYTRDLITGTYPSTTYMHT